MVWSCEKENGERSVEISRRNGSIGGKRKVGRPKKTCKDIVKRDFEWMRILHWIEEDGERSLQVRPPLKGKIWTLNEMMTMFHISNYNLITVNQQYCCYGQLAFVI